uniref:Microtubule associated protein 10 n=1 Tax=Scleropages formosus TaxID=113540 RepID=A0A8C9RAG9_SCLFO
MAFQMAETLFSFELLVEYVRLDKLVKGKRLKPALGVRLLDFPTLLIYPRDAGEPEGQHDSDSGTSEYSFHRGKSCLFKIGLDSLHLHLSNTPLYTMVLDISSEIPKFVGGSLVPLAKLTERIKADVAERGISTPSAHGERVLVAVCNLMGEKIGDISLGYKLLSLGGNLIPHIPESQIYKVGSAQGKGEGTRFADTRVNDVEEARVILQPKPECSSVLLQKVELEGKQTDIIVSESKAKMESLKSTGTQTEGTIKKAKTIEVFRPTFDSETNLAVFYPPPLYYSRPVKRLEEHNSNRYTSVNTTMEGFSAEDHFSEEEEKDAGGDPPKSYLCQSVDKTKSRRPTLAPLLTPGDTIRQLPLLNALLVELSQLNIQPQQQNFSYHPNLTPLYKPEPQQFSTAAPEDQSKPQIPSAAISSTPRGRRSPSPRIRTNKCFGCSAASMSASPPKMEKVKWQRPKQAKRTTGSIPRTKLVYRLTNTVRLRMLRTNPELLKVHEYKEQHPKAQEQRTTQNVSHHSGAKTRKTQKPDGIKRREVFNRIAKLDKNDQTLMNSRVMHVPEEDHAQSQPWTKQGQSPSPVSEGVECNTQSFSSLDDVSKGSPEKKSSHYEEDKKMTVDISHVFSQNSDHNDEESWSDVSQPQSCTVNLTAHSILLDEKGSTVTSPVHKYSDSEHVEYPDDFETTEGSSPDFHSSPEPALISSRRAVSEDRFNLGSGPQSGQEAALSTLIKADVSPQRSLKGTYLIRARSESSDDSVSGPESVRARHQYRFQHSEEAAEGPSNPRDLGGSTSQQSDRFRDTPSVLYSCRYTSDSDPQFVPSPGSEISLTEHEDEEMEDELGSLGFENKYRHISELVINKLPGYTL